jgi:acetyl esterase/lipase
VVHLFRPTLFRPSLRHRLAVEVVRRTRRGGPVGDPATFRERFLAANERFPRRIPVDFTESAHTTVGLRVLEHVPGGVPPSRTLLYLHGGGYTKPAAPQQFAFARRIATDLGMRVLFPLYPLAPEHTWRDSRDALVALVSAAAVDAPEGVVLAGDSAGGGYALSVAQGVRDAGGTPSSHLVLVSPWVDLTASAPGQPEVALTDPWLTLSRVNIYATWWAGSQEDRARTEPSPGLGDLRGLPPTLRFCGTRDLLYPENALLSERARGTGWEDTFVTGPGLIHVYPLLPIPEARVAHRRIVEFLS